MKTIAAVLDASHAVQPFAETRPLRLAELDLAAPGPRELLVRIDENVKALKESRK